MAPQINDIEFATEIGQSLLGEVRRLQALLSERDEALVGSRDRAEALEREMDDVRRALRTAEENVDRCKDDNWNLEVANQELKSSLAEAVDGAAKVEAEKARQAREVGNLKESLEESRVEQLRLTRALDDAKARGETEGAKWRRTNAALAREKTDLQAELEKARMETAALRARAVPAPRSVSGATLVDDEASARKAKADLEADVFGSRPAFSARRRKTDASLAPPSPASLISEDSIDGSPTAHRAGGDIDTLRTGLTHARRTIETLRAALGREKEARMLLKRRLDVTDQAEVEDEVEVDGEWDDQGLEEGSKHPTRRGPNRATLAQRRRRGARQFAVAAKAVDDEDRVHESSMEMLADDDGALDEFGEEEDESPEAVEARLGLPRVEERKQHGLGIHRAPSTSSLFKDNRPTSAMFSTTPQEVLEAERQKAAAAAAKPASCDVSTMTDPQPEPEPVVIRIPASPPLLPAPPPEPVLVNVAVQTASIQLPDVTESSVQTVTLEEPLKPVLVDVATGTDPPLLSLETHTQTVDAATPEVVDTGVDPRPQTPPPPAPLLVDQATFVDLSELAPSPNRNSMFTLAPYRRDSSTTIVNRSPSLLPYEPLPPPRSSSPAASEGASEPLTDEAAPETTYETDGEFQDAHESLAVALLRDSEEESEDAADVAEPHGLLAHRGSPASVSAVGVTSEQAMAKIQLVDMAVQTDDGAAAVPLPPSPLFFNKRESVSTFGGRLDSPRDAANFPQSIQRLPPAGPTYIQMVGGGSVGNRALSPDSLVRSDSVVSTHSVATNTTTTTTTNRSPPVDKSRPPQISMPPPPSIPPPRTLSPLMPPPPPQVPESGNRPTRPNSPPPPELLQRAQTPVMTLADGLLAAPDESGRQSYSSMPPRQQPNRSQSTVNLRSAMRSQPALGVSSPSAYVPPNRYSSLSKNGGPREPLRRRDTNASEISSIGSGARMSIDSNRTSEFGADVRTREMPGQQRPPDGSDATDPAVIHAITQTMIGEFLHKYTRRKMTKGISEKRHRRFFWLHPYTKTLYWGPSDPGGTNVSQSKAKSGTASFDSIAFAESHLY
jgi:hypothetical protein